MKILVSGAGGFLGHYAVTRLLERGHTVRAIVRPASPEPEWTGDVEIFYADLRAHDDLLAAFADVDVVLHLASATSGGEDVQFASTVMGTEKLLEAMAKTSTRRLVLVSSLVVYDWGQAKMAMDENTPLEKDIYGMGAYTIAKVWQERVASKLAKRHSWDLTIMRPGFIWGPQHAEIAGMGRHFRRVYLMFGPFTRLPLTHVVNCADCLVTAIESSGSAGEIFNVIDDDKVRVWRYVKEYAKRTGQTGFMLPVPYRFGLGIAQLASIVSRMLFGKKGKLPSLLTPRRFEAQFKPIRFSNQKLKDKINWKPLLTFDECIKNTYQSVA
jgi:nucleoside-diphosphate-sugar epimerase